ncbi:MAG: tRNA 2-thiocytidine(32) synthetase TtcA [Proteobacteria bacterium]|jgi:tRNA 2-thiocytidine biosynthesis protein TtcA|nr:tRNA 2-thiocytidine(32) synthetase TtcA [Pseudomonadota bacterium]
MATTPAYERAKLQKRLRRQVGQAIADYAMIEAGDRVMVCLSGGKDSYTLLDILRQLQATAPIRFELVAVNLDQKQPNFPEHVLPTYLEGLGIEYHIIEQDTYSVVKALTPEGKTYCPVCSRMRRGALYNFARRIGATKVALGHHLDDIVETLFLNLFHGATLKAMPPKLLSDDGDQILIRPLAYCREKDIARWAEVQAFPIIPCDLCGSQDGLERQVIKRMLQEWERAHPSRIEKIAGALRRVVPSHLMDRELFDFAGLDDERAAREREGLRIPVTEA